MFDVEYSKKKESLFMILDSLAEKGFIPVETEEKVFDDKFITTFKNTINEDKIFISVCGQIKAGKSSFLNYFIFKGERILPEASTPETAKLAKIQHGEKDKAVVYFYTKDEWEDLKKEKIEDSQETFFEKFMQDDINNCAKQGIHPDSWLDRTMEVSDLSNLSDFTSKNGKYQPYVSYIDVFINNESFKDIVFVDTPGINDPNPVRTRITTEWVNHSTAVIYLMYSQQALGAPDIEFIDKYLSHIPSNRILFCLTKADLLQSNESIRNFVQKSLKEHPALKERHFIANNEVYPISTLAAILKKKNEEEEPLSVDDDFLLDNIMDNYPECYNKNGFIDDFIIAINSSLMDNKGAMLLEQIINSIKDVCNLKKELLNKEIVKLKNDIAGFLMSDEEFKQQIEIIKDKQEEIMGAYEKNYKPMFGKGQNQAIIFVTKTYNKKKENIIKKIENWIDQQDNFNQLEKNTIWELKHIIETEGLYIEDLNNELIKDYFDEIIEEVKRESENIIGEIRGFRLYISDTFLVSFVDINRDIEDRIYKEIKIGLQECKVKKWIFWDNLEDSKANVLSRVIDISEGIIKEEIDRIIDSIQGFVKRKLKELDEHYIQSIKKLQLQVKELVEKKETGTFDIKRIEDSIKKLDEEKQNIENERRIIFNKMKALQWNH